MRQRRISIVTILLLTIMVGVSLAISACGQDAAGDAAATATPRPAPVNTPDSAGDLARLEPAEGTYFGVNLDWSNDSAAAYNERLGSNAAVYVQFVRFPFSDAEKGYLDEFFEQVAAQRGIALLTLEPVLPLDEITPAIADGFASYLADINIRHDVNIMIRFAHEMNGSWYSWSQQPEQYIAAFRTVAASVHATVPEAAMLWAPNYGAGYPFIGGQFEASPGDPGFDLLDTNGDGMLSMLDDPYSPYYPGDDVVDWVGVSLYHWGSAWPWGENEAPEVNKFSSQLTGNYQGFNGDERAVPDFYKMFAEERAKPVAIVETAALFSPDAGGASAMEIKQTWWSQVFSPDIRTRFPQIKMINWFEWDKFETEVNGRIDWTLTRDPEVLTAFLRDFDSTAYLFAPLR